MKRFYRFFRPGGIAFFLAIALCILAATDTASAYSSGITGQTVAGCTCHSQGSATSLSFTSSSGSFNVSPGGTLTITFTVAHSSQSAAGADIGVVNSSNQNAGTLSPASGSGLQSVGSELTHSQAKTMSSGSASFTFTWTAPNTPGTYTIRAAGNAVNGNGNSSGDVYNTGTQTITVVSSPTVAVTAPNGGEEWCAGGTQNITWTSSNISNVKIELSSDGGASYPTTLVASTPAAAGSWAWSIPSGQQLGTQYKVRISDASNAATNDVGNGNFSIKGATIITTQPASQTGCEGTAVSLSVVASGANLSYQWRKGGTNIPGANGATYTISNPEMSQSGTYDVVVTGACGAAVTSSEATLTIQERPRITVPPASISGCLGESVQLSVTATGLGLSYQWRREGSPIAGANQATYTIAALSVADTGRYDVIVSGTCQPNATSNFASVRLFSKTSIASVSPSQSVCEGAAVTLSVESPGAQGYIWKKNGTAISGANMATYTIASMNPGAQGNYTVTVIGVCDSATSTPIAVSMQSKPSIAQQPAGVSVVEGEPIVLTVQVVGVNLTYQWKKNGSVIAGATSASLNIANSTPSDAGTYSVTVSGSCGDVVSSNAVVTVTPAGSGPALVLPQSSLDFGPVRVSAGMKEMTIIVRNAGSENLNITAMTLAGDNAADFAFVNAPSLPAVIAPAGTLELALRFSPSAEGSRTAKVSFSSNAASNPELGLEGTGALPKIEPVAAGAIDFSEVTMPDEKSLEIRFKNTGLIPVRITGAEVVNGQAAEFAVTSLSPSLPVELDPNAEVIVTVRYKPTTEGDVSTTLRVSAEGMATPLEVELRGKGLKSTSVGETVLASVFTVAPNPITDGTTIRVAGLPARAELAVVDAMGRTVRTLGVFEAAASVQTLWWDGRDNSGSECAAGVYRLVMTSGATVQSVPVVIVR